MKNNHLSILAILAALAIGVLFFIKNFSDNYPPAMFYAGENFNQTLENNSLYHIGVAQRGSFGIIETKNSNSILIGDLDHGTQIHILVNDKVNLKVLEINNGSQIHIYFASDNIKSSKLSIQKVGNGSQVHIYAPAEIIQDKTIKEININRHSIKVFDKNIGYIELYKGNNFLKLHELEVKDIQDLFTKQRNNIEKIK